MSTLEDQIREIKSRISAATQAHARASHDRDRAQAAADEAAAALASEFGVTSKESASEVLSRLEGDLSSALQAVQSTLEEIGA